MSTQILMPALSPTMEEGTLAKWHVRAGDQVRAGDVIAEIETDKATMEVEAVEDGRIETLLVPEGTEHVKVNQPIASLIAEGEGAATADAKAATMRAVASSFAGEAHAAPALSPRPSPQRGEAESRAAPVPDLTSPRRGEVASRSEAGEGDSRSGNGHDRLFASPLARRLARKRGIDLAAIKGSGPRGRIVKADIARAPVRAERFAAEIEEVREPRAMVRAPAPQLVGPTLAQPMSDEAVLALYQPGTYKLVPHDTMRRLIAERLTLAKQIIPHFYLSIDCKLDALLAARKRLNGLAPEGHPRAFKLSVNDFIIKAMAMALQEVPRANATWTSQGLLLHRTSDVAVAVALPNGGLFTPVIHSAEMKSLSEISNEMKDLAARARSKRLAPHEYQGGTTTISNLGMYGIPRFEAVINPPQASILAVGKAQKRPVIKKDAVKIATMMSVTLSVDHRVIDGALGAELLAAFKAFIQDPVTMLV
jgi:pyruvate dehydrogenase E2 component (dihydrolipoamide acetyltransferase)